MHQIFLGIIFGLKNDLLSVSDKDRVPIDVLLVSGSLQQGLSVVLTCEIESSQGIQKIL